jgi:hypothetical protein
MARGLVAFVSALIAIGFLWHLTFTTACSSAVATVDAGICDVEAGLCASNQDCMPATCDAGLCPTHCTAGGLDSSMSPIFCCALGPPPGTGDAGAPCQGPDDCASGVCVFTTNFQMYACSVACSKSADCPALLPACIFLDGGAAVTGSVPLDAGAFCGLP